MKIRTLTGKKAIAHQEHIDANNVYIRTSVIAYPILQLRAGLYKALGLEQHYFIVRHQYSPSDRRLLDMLYISRRDGSLGHKPVKLAFTDTIRYERLTRLYHQELSYKHEWVRVTKRGDKHPKFVWHADIDKYNGAKP